MTDPLVCEEPGEYGLCPIHGCGLYPARMIECPECEEEYWSDREDDSCSDPVDWNPLED